MSQGIQNNLFNNFINQYTQTQSRPQKSSVVQPKPTILIQPQQDSLEKEIHDPLMNYPLRGAAYANEVGAALQPISQTASWLLWVPALMYFGADIYDKYKRGKNNDYSKASHAEGMKQTCFQALASVILPTAAVKAGQHLAGDMYKHGKTKLNAQSREEVYRYIRKAVDDGKFNDRSKEDVLQSIEKQFRSTLNNLEKDCADEGAIKKIFKFFGHSEKPYASMKAFKKKPHELIIFLKDKTSEIFDIRESLVNENTRQEALGKLSKKLSKAFTDVAEGPNSSEMKDPIKQAANLISRKILKNRKMKINSAKTLGGFIALAFLAIPIDHFVEKFIMKSFLAPSIDKVSVTVKEINKTLKFQSNHSEEA